MRESPSLEIFNALSEIGCKVSYHDPLIAKIESCSKFPELVGKNSVELQMASTFDATIIATDHDDIDYNEIAQSGCLVIDTRNALGSRSLSPSILIKA